MKRAKEHRHCRTVPPLVNHMRTYLATHVRSTFICIALFPASYAYPQAPPAHLPTLSNVQTGSIAAVDAAQETLSLHTRDGRTVEYRFTAKTRVFRNKQPAATQDLKPGDEVVVHFRRSRSGLPSLYEVTDRSSWEWFLRLRSQITAITLTDVSEDHIAGKDSSGAGPIEYRVSPKTLWGKENKPAGPAEFKVGDLAFVAPRPLPSGGIMAAVVADTQPLAARLKEHTRRTVTAVIAAVDLPARQLTLHTAAGDQRILKLAADCVIREASRDVKPSFLRPGLRVTAHISKDIQGEEVITRITIQKPKALPSPPLPSGKAVPRKR